MPLTFAHLNISLQGHKPAIRLNSYLLYDECLMLSVKMELSGNVLCLPLVCLVVWVFWGVCFFSLFGLFLKTSAFYSDPTLLHIPETNTLSKFSCFLGSPSLGQHFLKHPVAWAVEK